MRVAVWPADQKGCGHYRLIYPATALINEGADVVIDWRGPTVLWDRPWDVAPGPTHRAMGLAEPYPADVVVMQRCSRRWWSDLIPHLQAQGTKVVVDVDDLMDDIDRRNIAYADQHGTHVNHQWADLACKLADLVTCTTPPLMRRYGHGHGVVLPNLVPEAYANIYGLKQPETIGWAGFVETHPGDLQATEGAVAEVAKQSGWGVHVIGTGAGVRRDLRLDAEPSTKGPVEFRDYSFALAELEVGIVPLADTPFNRAKSCLKAAEMAALGVPVVMSPTPDNVRLHRLGVGVLADSRSQWRRQLGRLVKDAAWRYELAERGREVMADQTYEQKASMWWDAWNKQAEEAAA